MISKKALTSKINVNGKRLGLFILTLIIAYGICATAVVPKKYNLEVGEIAKVDIKANRDAVDEKATQENIDEAVSKVEKQYASKESVQKQAKEDTISFFDKIVELKKGETKEEDIVKDLSKINDTGLKESDFKLLSTMNVETLSQIKNSSLNVLDKVYSKTINEDKEEDLDNAKITVSNEIEQLNYDSKTKVLMKTFINNKVKPNLGYDKESTEQAIKDVEKNVPKVTIKKNQTIVKEGEQVTERQIEILNELGLLNDSNNYTSIIIYIILFFFVFLIISLHALYIYRYHKKIYNSMNQLKLISSLVIINLLLARGLSLINPFLIPIATVPLLLTLLSNYRLSIVISVFNSILVAGVVDFDPEIIILSIVISILGATSLRKMQQRNDILYACIYIAFIAVVLTFTTGMLLSNNMMMEVLKKSAMAATGSILSGILAVGLLPFLENTFDVVTTVKLLELSNPNNPLLKKLLMEAPGTYHHSVLVANLAEMAAEEVGGNPVLARVGAYYHDVGKTNRPYFFKENQFAKENPHDKITPNLSTLIITSHVKDGVELAKEYGVPVVIQDIIAQHHGTTLVKYFYYKAKKAAENEEDIKEEDFRYPGPIPQTKEAAIIMLADSTEAAVRSIPDPTKGKIEEMVNNIIKDKLYTNQLDNCDLTLRDLDKIRNCFLRTLNGIYHERIEYPTENSIRGKNK